MGKPTGFLENDRVEPSERPIDERVRDYREVSVRLPIAAVKAQASRCMDCGVPFCHGGTSAPSGAAPSAAGAGHSGCPLGNVIPEFNDHVYRGRLDRAARTLYRTNNFPEVTGRVCPAPCERACVLDLSGQPVTIESIERHIADDDFERHGAFVPQPAAVRTGKRVVVVGSGPAGLAAAQQLARAGHDVEVLDRSDRIGGLLRYGIPDFKLEKVWIDRRVEQMRAEGVAFRTCVEVGRDETLASLSARADAVILAIGAGRPRDLEVPGRELAGVSFAMPYLEASNRHVAAPSVRVPSSLDAKGKRVIVIGGGDTGSDCIGTAVRQGAASVVNLELLPEPPHERSLSTPWPSWPLQLRTSSSHEEAAHLAGHDVRRFALETTRLLGDERGHVRALEARRVEVVEDERGRRLVPVADAEPVVIEADLVLLAMGFAGVDAGALGVMTDARGNVASSGHATPTPNVFVCGDARRGQSLVVWAIAEGRACADAVSRALGAAAARAARRSEVHTQDEPIGDRHATGQAPCR
jgi:glutamate synthase (NADPH/NADH) small chain